MVIKARFHKYSNFFPLSPVDSHHAGEACEVDGGAEGEERGEEGGEEDVAAVLGAVEAGAGEVPGAVDGADASGLADHVGPVHLRECDARKTVVSQKKNSFEQ